MIYAYRGDRGVSSAGFIEDQYLAMHWKLCTRISLEHSIAYLERLD